MHGIKYFRLLILWVMLLASCSPARFVRPLEKGQHAGGLSLGGPLFKLDETTIPMPFLSAVYGYGFNNTLTAFGSWNITSALYGNAQVDFGVTKRFVQQKKFRPAITLTPVVNIIYRNPDAAKIYPQLDLNAGWEYGRHKNYFYLGICNWFELAKERTLEQRQPNQWLFTPMLGHVFSGSKWDVNLEAKWITPNLSNEKLVIEYKTPFKNSGALGVYVGIIRKLR